LGRSALVLDDTGHFEALAVAEFLIAKGIAVTLVTRWPSITPYVDTTMRTVPALERLHAGDFTPLTRHLVVAIAASCFYTYLSNQLETLDLEMQNASLDLVNQLILYRPQPNPR